MKAFLSNKTPGRILAGMAILLGSLLYSSPALAATPTLTWSGQNVVASGDHFAQNATFLNASQISSRATITLSGVEATVNNDQCVAQGSLRISSDFKQGYLSIVAFGPSFSLPGGGGQGPVSCSQQVLNSYNKSVGLPAWVSIGGTPQTGSGQETEAQKSFTMTYYSSLPESKSPKSVQVTITNKAGYYQWFSVDAIEQISGANDLDNDPNYVAVYYPTPQATLEAGEYTICVTPYKFVKDPQEINAQGCSLFTKIKGQAVDLSAGQDTEYNPGGAINVRVSIPYTGDETSLPGAIGPATLSMTDAHGHKTTIKTDSFNPSSPSKNQWSAGSGLQSSTFYLNGTFGHVAAGKYKICVDGTSACKSIDANGHTAQAVSIALTADQATQIIDDSNSQGHESNPTCEASPDPLTWILCPIYNGVAGFSDWVFSNLVQPLLRTSPVSLNPTDPSFRVWSSFRVYGDIFLVIALLIIVFGQSLGGGMIDAYTTKKVLPRILAAAILLNLSVYIVAFAVDVTNVIGGSIGAIMTEPLNRAGAFNISLSGVQAGTIVGVPTIAAALGGIGLLVGAIPPMIWILIFLVLPAGLALLAAFVTLILRKAILLALILVSPVAFALYCLPNTEEYFKKWWGLLIKTLLVYPIVIIIFAVADILSVTVMMGNSKQDPIPAIISFLLQFLPLFLIPYAFTLAGGAIGKIHEVLRGVRSKAVEGIKGNPNDPSSLRRFAQRKYQGKLRQARVVRESSLRNSNSSFKRGISRYVGGGALTQERVALDNMEKGKHMEAMWGSSDDSFVKASTIAASALGGRRAAYEHAVAGGMSVADAERRFRYRTAARASQATQGKINQEQWAAADDTWFTGSVIKQADSTYGSVFEKQTNFRKLLEKTESLGTTAQNNVLEDYMEFASEAGLDDGTATGNWQGIAIPMKHMRMDMRRAELKRNPTTGKFERTGVNNKGLLTEFANTPMHGLVAETPGNSEALANGILEAYQTGQNGQLAAHAFYNFQRFVEGAPSGQAAAAAAAAGALAPPAGGQAQPGQGQTYASSSSAAWRNAEAARIALEQLKNTPGLITWLDSHKPQNLPDFH